MKGDWKIPFKKLEWHSGVTEEGEKLGFVHQIGEFYQSRHKHPLRKYLVINSSGNVISESISVWSSDDDKKLGEVQTVEEGKELCQKDFESYIMKTFFESDGRAV
jgi:hypothetical protein